MKTKNKIRWLSTPENHDYTASFSYLSLLFTEAAAKQYMEELQKAPIIQYKAKDIFRASSLSLLGVSNKHIKRDLKKIKSDESLSPLLLVRDLPNGKLIIADGYHRLCEVYSLDEDALIPCKIV
jgi:disulfide oxidoreductase YuzD